MIKKIILLLTMLHVSMATYAQHGDLPDDFLGFGWIVGFGYDRAFFPSEKLSKVPKVEDFFKQKKKYGVRVNEEENAYEALQQSQVVKIVRKGKADTLYITPVVACFKLYKKFENLEMLQVYSYKGKVDSVFYQFGIDFDLQLSIIK